MSAEELRTEDAKFYGIFGFHLPVIDNGTYYKFDFFKFDDSIREKFPQTERKACYKIVKENYGEDVAEYVSTIIKK